MKRVVLPVLVLALWALGARAEGPEQQERLKRERLARLHADILKAEKRLAAMRTEYAAVSADLSEPDMPQEPPLDLEKMRVGDRGSLPRANVDDDGVSFFWEVAKSYDGSDLLVVPVTSRPVRGGRMRTIGPPILIRGDGPAERGERDEISLPGTWEVSGTMKLGTRTIFVLKPVPPPLAPAIAKSESKESAPDTSGDASPGQAGAGGPKSVHVSGYTRKDGTPVKSYDRAAPGHGGGRRR